MLNILTYNDLEIHKIPHYKKISNAIRQGDFRSAQVKKIGDNLYRAKLNDADRLLFAFYQYKEQTYILMLEWIKNHDYASSRFLNRGVSIDENNIEKTPTIKSVPKIDLQPNLAYINPKNSQFSWLGKCISFDDVQQAIYDTQPPLVIIGSAGSGKTALLLEKLKQTSGDVLYVSLSAYLVKNANELYYSDRYVNDKQQVDFYSYQEFLESIHIPDGKPIEFVDFKKWFIQHARGNKIKDAHKVFEEFRGVLTSNQLENGYLSREDYQNLGVRQSIFLAEERDAVYDLFEKYLRLLSEKVYYDTNLISHQWLARAKPRYDFVVIDEVQDFTNIQLYLVLQHLKYSGQFLLCGDANQIVHPNFFSWANIKSLFYHQEELQGGHELMRILHTNYRNSPEVTAIANRILLLKNARFGSIDKESHYLVQSNGHVEGSAILLRDKPDLLSKLNDRTRQSTQFAVIVMHDSQKAEASKHFNTPLIFSIQEAKGLEYSNIILYNFVSSEEKRFSYISQDVSLKDLQKDILKYSRNKDKTDKSLEVYKFYINALYVALTRAVKNIYWVESRHKHPLLALLQLPLAVDSLEIEDSKSSVEEWQKEAQKLAMQGKEEQAKRIQTEVLKQKVVNWEVLQGEALQTLKEKALDTQEKKAGIMLLEYAQVYDSYQLFCKLQEIGLKATQKPLHSHRKTIIQKYFNAYTWSNFNNIEKQLDSFGLEFRDRFNRTPLMNAVWVGNVKLIQRLLERGADTQAIDNQMNNPFRIALKQSLIGDKDAILHVDSGIKDKQKYAKNVLPELYDWLAPNEISVQTQGRLVKLAKHTMEYFLFNIMQALLITQRSLSTSRYKQPYFDTASLLQAIEFLPESILPKYRRKRQYLTSILSKNEVSRNDPYNRQLFLRIATGKYIIHPEISIKVQGEWRNIYELME
ncbi:MAG: AAA family ATPase [Moraxellaceae bacterium]|nr:AAA family ATPase [Moraxellaceae bacterium]